MDLDIDQVVTTHPARYQQLLAQVDEGLRALHARVTHHQRVSNVGALHFHQARVETQGVGGAHIAHDIDALGEECGLVMQARAEVENADGQIVHVANQHHHAIGLVADFDPVEAGLDGRQVAHAQRHVAGGATGGVVAPVGGLAGAADAVVLRRVHGLDGQFAGAAQLVVARAEAHVVGHQQNVFARAVGGDDTAFQVQQGLARRQLDVDLALGCIHAALRAAPAIADQQAVFLADHEVAAAQVGYREPGQLGGELAHDASGRLQVEVALGRYELGIHDVDAARRGELEPGGAPAKTHGVFERGQRRRIGDFYAVEPVVEVDQPVAVQILVRVEENRRVGLEGVQHNAVQPGTTLQVQHTRVVGVDDVVAA